MARFSRAPRSGPTLGYCAKYRCHLSAATVELETGARAETFPNALCAMHARRPDKRGTYAEPVMVEA